MRIITLTIALLVLLAPGCTSSTTKRACHGGIISALESRHRNAVNVALWTLGNNGFDVPEIEFKGSYAEAEPKLKKLVDQLAKLPSARLRELDESYRDHATIYSPYYPPSLGSDDGWKESLTLDVTTTHDRSPHAEAIALVVWSWCCTNTKAKVRRPRPPCPKEGRTSLLSCPRTSSPENT